MTDRLEKLWDEYDAAVLARAAEQSMAHISVIVRVIVAKAKLKSEIRKMIEAEGNQPIRNA